MLSQVLFTSDIINLRLRWPMLISLHLLCHCTVIKCCTISYNNFLREKKINVISTFSSQFYSLAVQKKVVRISESQDISSRFWGSRQNLESHNSEFIFTIQFNFFLRIVRFKLYKISKSERKSQNYEKKLYLLFYLFHGGNKKLNYEM